MMNPVYIQFGETPDEGNIRKWSAEPFGGGVRYEAVPVWNTNMHEAPRDGTLVDLRAGPIVNLGCVWETTRKGGRWIILEGDYLPTIEPCRWRFSLPPAPEQDA